SEVRLHAVTDEGAGRLEPAVEVDGGDERLECVDEDGSLVAASGLLLAPIEPKELAEVDVAGELVERPLADEIGLHLRELPLVLLGKALEEPLTDEKAEDRIAEQLVALVVTIAF